MVTMPGCQSTENTTKQFKCRSPGVSTSRVGDEHGLGNLAEGSHPSNLKDVIYLHTEF